MSSIGTGVRRHLRNDARPRLTLLQYDLSAATYSPDGRVFQVEYAVKAVDNSGTVLGIRCKDGVVLAVEKLVHTKLLTPGQNRRIQNVDKHVGIVLFDFYGTGWLMRV
jgi:20S proteasome subunit alpha 7